MNNNDYRLRAYKAAGQEQRHGSAPNDTATNFASLDSVTQAIKNGGLLKVPRGGSDDLTSAVAGGGKGGADSVYRRVAKFLLLIGSDRAAEVLRFLSPDDVEKIIPEIATIRSVDEDEAAAILEEFRSLVETKKEGGGEATAFNILEKAFGQSRAEGLMKKLEPRLDGAHPFSYLKDKTNEEILSLLKGEGSQVVALVLSYLEPEKAASVINIMEAGQKKEVVLRLAKMKKVSPDVIQAIDKTIREKASKIVRDDSIEIDGRSALAEILKRMDSGRSQELLGSIERSDPELGMDLEGRLFTIQDVAECDDKFIQKKLAAMSDKEIAYLIAGKDDAFVKKIFSNVSTGRGDMILEEEAASKPMLKKDVDDITNAFVSSLRAAWEKGELFVRSLSDEDEYVQ